VLIRPVDRKTFEERTFPHAYTVIVYRENDRYYAKDRRGNIICIDSQTSCLQEAIDYVNDEKLGWIDNEGVGIIEVLTDLALPKQVVVTPQNRIWMRFHGKVWIGWINPPSPDEPYGAIKIGDGSISTWIERPIIIEGGIFHSDPSKKNLYAFQINRIHGVVIRHINVAYGNLADVVGEATQTLIDHCQIANPAGIAIRFRTGPYSFGPGASHVSRTHIQDGANPESTGIAVYDNEIWITETWIESVPNAAVVVNPPEGTDEPRVMILNSVIAGNESTGDLIKINYDSYYLPHLISNNFFALHNPTSYVISIDADNANVVVENNAVSLYNGAGFVKATGNNGNYTIIGNKVGTFQPTKSNIFNALGTIKNLVIESNNFYNYYYSRYEANSGVYYGQGEPTIHIPHGLGTTPSRYIIMPVNTPQPDSISVDSKKITLTYSTPPDYVYIRWYVEV
jgi:hypothetical protein